MKLKRLVPRMIIGATMAVMMAVPVSASNINSGSPPPIEFSELSSTNDVAADSQNSDDSGKVYDFKDSKTSGVVTVTKTGMTVLLMIRGQYRMFLSVPWNLQNLTELILSHFMEMEEMFSNCHTLTTLDLTSFYTSKVTDMSYMFSDCTALNL